MPFPHHLNRWSSSCPPALQHWCLDWTLQHQGLMWGLALYQGCGLRWDLVKCMAHLDACRQWVTIMNMQVICIQINYILNSFKSITLWINMKVTWSSDMVTFCTAGPCPVLLHFNIGVWRNMAWWGACLCIRDDACKIVNRLMQEKVRRMQVSISLCLDAFRWLTLTGLTSNKSYSKRKKNILCFLEPNDWPLLAILKYDLA